MPLSEIAPISIGGCSKRCCFAELGDYGIVVDGWNSRFAYNKRRGGNSNVGFGMNAPTSPPTSAAGAAGNVKGPVRYRTRWMDQHSGLISLPSDELSVTANSTKITVTLNAGLTESRATHWIIERTVANGKVFYPVNIDDVTDATAYGTPIGTTTFSDNISDAILQERDSLPERQAVPNFYPKICFPNIGRMFYIGAAKHRVTATLANNSDGVTNTSGLGAWAIGADLVVDGDTDGKSYRIIAQTGTGATLDRAYTGTDGDKTVTISQPSDVEIWSEPGQPEACGEAEISESGVSNSHRIGDDGGDLTAGVGLGQMGVLLAKENQLYYHKYRIDPDPSEGDGEIVALQSGRGVVPNHKALKFYDGVVYGLDRQGLWRMAPGGAPEDFGWPIQYEFRRNQLNFNKAENWFIQRDTFTRMLYVFVSYNYEDYPRKAWLFNMQTGQWENSKTFPWGVTSADEMPDQSGQRRIVFYNQAEYDSEYLPSICWMDNLGVSFGAKADTAPLNGNVTGPGSGFNTLESTGALWPTGDQDLVGVPVTKISKTLGTVEQRIITGNTADTLTVSQNWLNSPAAGDWYQIGPIPARFLTPRFAPGQPDRKTVFHSLCLWIKWKTTCTPVFVMAFYDGSSQATPFAKDKEEDGVTYSDGYFAAKLDPTFYNDRDVQAHRFELPLSKVPATSVQFLIFSDAAGAPWEIFGPIRLKCKVDDSAMQRRM